MTVIAVKDGIMAADSRMTGSYVSVTPKLYRHHDAIIGFAGSISEALVFVDWYRDKSSRTPDVAHETNWEALILTPEGIEWWDRSLRAVKLVETKAAIGSGGAIAMTAMDCGKSAKEAVAFACKRDPYCALPIITMSLKPRKVGKRG